MAPRKRSHDEDLALNSDDAVRPMQLRPSKSPSSSLASDVSTLHPPSSRASEPSTAPTEDNMVEDDESGSDMSTSSKDTSSGSDVSEDEDSEDEELSADEERATIVPQSRRKMKSGFKVEHVEKEAGVSLRNRLKDFLPQLAAANEELEAERLDGTLGKRNIESVDENDQRGYIEMDLGLGVLEQARTNDDKDTSDEEADDEGSAPRSSESSVLDKLLRRRTNGKSAVEVMEDDT